MALTAALISFIAATAVLCSLWIFFGTETPTDVIKRRIESVRRVDRGADVELELKLLRDELYSSVPLFHRVLTRLSWISRLQDFITQAGMTTKAAKVLLLSAVIALTAYLATALFYPHIIVQLLIGFVVGILPFLAIAWMRQRRLRQFEEHFPEALDLLGRAVRAGHAFTAGLEMMSKESPEPIASEFRTTFEEQNFGLPLRDALVNLTERVPLVDVRFFVTALVVQKETGGNLAEILDELARVIRERFRIYREVRVKTAQGRLTATILILLPLAILMLMRLFNPVYISVLFTDSLGTTLLLIALLLQMIGSILIWKIIQIKV